jgi:ABC-type lipoprotein export system ATPase subunit
MSELEEGLLSWSQARTDWQRDLLRRLAGGDVLSRIDYRAYADAAERDDLVQDGPWFVAPDLGSPAEFVPLDATHLRATAAGVDPLSITRVLHIEGANNLAAGAVLAFEAGPGLTIVAGRNGSGKSGYTRIFKQVAASRGSESVLPNAFSPAVVPKAVVTYEVGSTSAVDFTWEAGQTLVESPLQRARVFDGQAASVQLAGSTEIAYVPPTLQVLADYTQALQEIAALVDADSHQDDLRVRHWPELETGAALDIFEHLGEQTGLAALQAFQALTAEELAELQEIPAQLRDLTATNPAALAVQARGRAGQLNTLARNFEIVNGKLKPEAIAASKSAREAVKTAADAVLEASQQLQAAAPIEGISSQRWRNLWEAAKAFVEQDQTHEFPDSAEGATCPLCRQTLDGAARSLFQEYATFLQGQAQSDLASARELRKADIDALAALPLDSMISQDVVDLVTVDDPTIGGKLLPLIARATEVRSALLAEIVDIETGVAEVEDLELIPEIEQVVLALRARAEVETATSERLAATDTSAVAAARLAARRDALALRQSVSAKRNEIGEQHDLALRSARIAAAKRACDTTAASRQNTQLSREYVEKVCSRFELETRALGLERVPVELVFDRSSRGVSYIKVSLKGAGQIAVASVLSEGEQRVTAIAGFFADLAESGDQSTLIFDDPVSSLDQEFRVRVAQRLLVEAESRQVLVFTHDFSFVQYLFEEKRIRDTAKQAAGETPSGDLKYLHIDRTANGAGVPTNAEQWRHVSIRERISRLNERIQNVEVLYRNGDGTAYEKEARDIVGAIRDTWEAFVELEFLNGVVTRHDRSVQTQRLNKLSDISDQDIAGVTLGMGLESRFMTGHAAPVSDGSGVQPPDWLRQELKNLTDLRKAILDRR